MTTRGGKTVFGASLGILMLNTRFPRVPGDIGNATTWPFPVHYRIVRGATPDKVVRKGAEGTLAQVESTDSEYDSIEASDSNDDLATPAPKLEHPTPPSEAGKDAAPVRNEPQTAVARQTYAAASLDSDPPAFSASKVTTRPVAPPSLAASLVASGSKRGKSKPSRKGKYLMNSSNHDTFQLAVSKPFIKFKARFYFENDPQADLQGSLPESWVERGRLRIEEFSKFLSGKLKGGRWTATLLRLSVSSDEHKKAYKEFYKEYESMKRIAMFSVSENSKLFLVTPKFHRAASKALGSSFNLSVAASTYAIALSRA